MPLRYMAQKGITRLSYWGLDTPLKLAIQKQLIKSHFVVKPAPTYLGGELTGNFVNKDLKHAGVQLSSPLHCANLFSSMIILIISLRISIKILQSVCMFCRRY